MNAPGEFRGRTLEKRRPENGGFDYREPDSDFRDQGGMVQVWGLFGQQAAGGSQGEMEWREPGTQRFQHGEILKSTR